MSTSFTHPRRRYRLERLSSLERFDKVRTTPRGSKYLGHRRGRFYVCFLARRANIDSQLHSFSANMFQRLLACQTPRSDLSPCLQCHCLRQTRLLRLTQQHPMSRGHEEFRILLRRHYERRGCPEVSEEV